jgi:type III restriction enzyme
MPPRSSKPSAQGAMLPGIAPIFSKVIINDAYTEPTQHLNLLRQHANEPERLEGRRPAGYFRKDATGQEVFEEMVSVNRLRDRLREWRASGYAGATHITQSLLRQWNSPDREGLRQFFCQREAAEAIIWLTEGPASQRSNLDFRAPDDFVRYCCKLATGAGKTTVMAMLIAWSALNRLYAPRDPRFTDAVLVVCPNLTVLERLQELLPSHADNTYRKMGLLPEGTDFAQTLTRARIQIVNWHKLAVQDDDGKRGVVQRGEESDPAFARRVLTDLGNANNILVFNDEAHHAWRYNPQGAAVIQAEEALEVEDEEQFARAATVWVEGLDRIHRARNIRLCVDMSATPYFTALSRYPDGEPFPWVVSDFGLSDAVECGIVKIPRVPKGDDSGESEPKYLHLWEHVKDKLSAKALSVEAEETDLLKVLMSAEGAMRSLAYHWSKTFDLWTARKSPVPPCMIVVCNNTRVAGFLADFIARGDLHPALQNDAEHEHTLRIDSAALQKAEGGTAGAAEEGLRKKVGTVGKAGQPGGAIRCVVSVAMLSEGWDARNVTQILGLRAFSSRLLCEQVIGRGLRRADYTDLWSPEYVDIYGVPFSLIPVQRDAGSPSELEPAKPVKALAERAEYEIRFPRVVGYRPETTVDMKIDVSKLEPVEFDPSVDPTTVVMGEGVSYYGTHGQLQPLPAGETFHLEDALAREQTVAFQVARDLCDRLPEHHARFLFPRALEVATDFIEHHVVTHGQPRRLVALTRYQSQIVERILAALTTATGVTIHRPVPSPFSPEGSTASVDFMTRKPLYAATKSQVTHVVCDPQHKDVDPEKLWEYQAAAALDAHPRVKRFVKNDHLGFSIPYLHQKSEATYVPDFLVVVACDDGEETTLVLEVKGWVHDLVAAKNMAAKKWVAAINADGSWGRWSYAIVYHPNQIVGVLDHLAQHGTTELASLPRHAAEAGEGLLFDPTVRPAS